MPGREAPFTTYFLHHPPTNGKDVVSKSECAIVNVRDTLRFLSNERFRSVMHRVSPPGNEDRYSTAYFLRAADGTIF